MIKPHPDGSKKKGKPRNLSRNRTKRLDFRWISSLSTGMLLRIAPTLDPGRNLYLCVNPGFNNWSDGLQSSTTRLVSIISIPHHFTCLRAPFAFEEFLHIEAC